jgi:hypothetical protein
MGHQRSFEKFIQLDFIEDLITNINSRFGKPFLILANKGFVKLVLFAVIDQVQDLNSPFIKVLNMVPEWDQLKHSLSTERSCQQAHTIPPVLVTQSTYSMNSEMEFEGLPIRTNIDPM